MRMKALFAGLVVALLVACNSGTDASNLGLTGTFKLVAVDGSPLPFKSGGTMTVRGTLSIQNNGRYALSQTDSTAGAAASTTNSQGIWVITDLALTLHPDPGGVILGIWIPTDSVRLTGPHENA